MKAAQTIHKISVHDTEDIASLFFNAILIGLIFFYVSLYPPFIFSVLVDPFIRLIFETLTLICLLYISVLRTPWKIQRNIIWLIILILLHWTFSLDENEKIFSFFNKLLFFILLLKAVHKKNKMGDVIKIVWVFVWTIFSVSSVLATIGFMTGVIAFQETPISDYLYYHNSLLGNVVPKHFGIIILPRYTGWFFEPGFLGYFFGMNMFISEYLFADRRRQRHFKWLNTIAGILTVSLTFYFFLISFILFKFSKKAFKRIYPMLIFIVLLFLIPPALYILNNPEVFLYSSLGDRIWRFEKSWTILTNLNLVDLLFGRGIMPLQADLEGGSTSGLIDVFLGRGVLLFCFLTYLVYRYAAYHVIFLIFIFYSSFFFNFFTQPLFFLGMAIGYECFLRQTTLLDMRRKVHT